MLLCGVIEIFACRLYRKLFKRYVSLYKKKLHSASDLDVVQLDECEQELHIESIVLARKEAERQVGITSVSGSDVLKNCSLDVS